MPLTAKTEKRVIRGPDGPVDVQLTKLAPRRGFLTLIRLVKAIGAPAASGLSQPDKLAKFLTKDLTLDKAGLALLINALPGLGETNDSPGMSAIEVMSIADDLLVGHAVIDKTTIAQAEVIDVMVPDVYTLLRILRFALEFNFGPTSAGGATSDGSPSPAPTSAPDEPEA